MRRLLALRPGSCEGAGRLLRRQRPVAAAPRRRPQSGDPRPPARGDRARWLGVRARPVRLATGRAAAADPPTDDVRVSPHRCVGDRPRPTPSQLVPARRRRPDPALGGESAERRGLRLSGGAPHDRRLRGPYGEDGEALWGTRLLLAVARGAPIRAGPLVRDLERA